MGKVSNRYFHFDLVGSLDRVGSQGSVCVCYVPLRLMEVWDQSNKMSTE